MLTYLNLSLRSLRSSQLNRFPPHRGKGPPVCTNIQRGSWGTDGSQQKRWQSWSNQSNDNNFLVKQDKQLNWQPTQWWHQGWAVVKGEILNSGKRGMIFKLNRPSNNAPSLQRSWGNMLIGWNSVQLRSSHIVCHSFTAKTAHEHQFF